MARRCRTRSCSRSISWVTNPAAREISLGWAACAPRAQSRTSTHRGQNKRRWLPVKTRPGPVRVESLVQFRSREFSHGFDFGLIEQKLPAFGQVVAQGLQIALQSL